MDDDESGLRREEELRSGCEELQEELDRLREEQDMEVEEKSSATL